MLCESLKWKGKMEHISCLNPCSNGRCSARLTLVSLVIPFFVLILVLMEDALRGDFGPSLLFIQAGVLILVLMEDALRGKSLIM